MHIILGGTGRVGSATARNLLAMGEQVTVVTRERNNAKALADAGAEIAEVDVLDVERLRKVFRQGRRALVLNPPAAPSADTDARERATVKAILNALEGSALEKIVAASTYGAFAGKACGDLTVLFELEEGLKRQAIPTAINRAAYYMSNWLGFAAGVREHGQLVSFFPADLELAMVSPDDLGRAAAQRLTSPASDTGIANVEGPARYTPTDVAKAFGEVVAKPVELDVVPSAKWQDTFRKFGFSAPAARSYACMTQAVLGGRTQPDQPTRQGDTSLRAYLRQHIQIGRG